MKKFLSLILAVMMAASVMTVAFAAESETVILYTNDVHCAVEDYAVLAAYRAELISQGKNVVLVDAGDAIQGDVIGSETEGKAVADIMNAVGYDYAVPGNHEFDYGMEAFLDIAKNQAEYEYISSNFYYLPKAESVFAPYSIEDFGDFQVAFVGITTPDTITSSTPDYFKDENGNFNYGFPVFPGAMTNELLYENIQDSVDDAIDDGADYVVAVGHVGIIGSNDGWKASDIIANTDGIDYFIDAHSHETTEKATYKNNNGEDVFLTSTGEKFAYFGALTISGGSESFELINPDDVNVEEMSEAAKTAYDTVKAKIDGYNEEIAYIFEEIGTSEAHLTVYDSESGRVVRKRETNAGDFVADAYRAVTGADVAIVNGGGVRADVEIGPVTRKSLMNVNSFGNNMCVIEVTGQQIIDILEHGARRCPEELGSFFQVSGMTFEIHTYRETPVIEDQLGNFIGIDGTKERRVQNVCIGGEFIELDKKYSLAGSTYVLLQDGDGLTMLAGSKILQQEGLPLDFEMLIKYFTEDLDGVISEEMYGNPDGDGRITVYESEPAEIEYDYEIKYGETITVSVNSEETKLVKFVPKKSGKYQLVAESDGHDTYCDLHEGNLDEIVSSADDENGYDFVLDYEFRCGKAYYFEVKVYSEGDFVFNVTLGCGHSFENGICTFCQKVCDHTESAELGRCLCGEFFLGQEINDGDEYEVGSEAYNNSVWFRFVPEESGTYSFRSVSDGADPDCEVYNADNEWLKHSYDVYNKEFDLVYYFEAGEEYYFNTYNCYDVGAFKVILSRVTHTAADGSEHCDFEITDETYSNCTYHGYTEGVYCIECEEYISGHEEKELNKFYHIDEDGDELCELCGESVFFECKHICHSENFFLQIIWKIINFFNKLFGISPFCECGEFHFYNYY